jgi:hypothetical protein
MKNTKKLALELAQEARSFDKTRITIVESSGILLANICGVIACRDSAQPERGEQKMASLALTDLFGDTHLVQPRLNRFIFAHNDRRREMTAENFALRNEPMKLEVSSAMAALAFLDDRVDMESFANPEELTHTFHTTSFHHGVDNRTTHENRVGWRFRLDEDQFTQVTVDMMPRLDPLVVRRVKPCN